MRVGWERALEIGYDGVEIRPRRLCPTAQVMVGRKCTSAGNAVLEFAVRRRVRALGMHDTSL